MNKFKLFGFAAAIGFATASLITKQVEDKKRQKELDDFLLPDEDQPVVVDIPREECSLEEDVLACNESPVIFKFKLDSKENAVSFQDALSEKGLSSTIDVDSLMVEVMYNGDLTEESLEELLSDLKTLSVTAQAIYKGYH